MIHLQDQDGHTPSWGKGYGTRPIYSEVIFPTLCSRVEEGSQNTCFRIQRAKVRAFVSIAVRAGERQIIRAGNAAMFFGYNVFHLECEHSRRLRKSALLTTPFCSFGHELT